MGFTYVRRNGSNGGTLAQNVTSFTFSPTTGASAGDGVILHIGVTDATVTPTAVADNAGNTWTVDSSEATTTPGQIIARSDLTHAITSSTVITITIPNTGSKTVGFCWSLDEFTNPSAAARVTDGHSTPQASTGTLADTGATPTPSATDLCVAAFVTFGSIGSITPAGFTALAAVTALPMQIRLAYDLGVTTAQTVTAALNGSNPWAAMAQLYSAFATASARTAADTVAVSDSVTRSRSAARTAADSVAVGDSVAKLDNQARSAADSVAVSDAAAKINNQARGAGDTAAVSDSVAKLDSQARSAADAIPVADAATKLDSQARRAADAVSVGDSTSTAMSTQRAASDVVAVSDAVTDTTHTARSAADTASVSDTATRDSLASARTAHDTVSVSDVVSATNSSISASDAISVSDAAGRELSLGRRASDSVSVNDQAGASKGGGRSASDHTLVSDGATLTTSMGRNTADSVSVFDAVAVVLVTIVLNPGRLNGNQTSGGVLVPSEIDGDTLRAMFSASGPSEAAVSAGQSMLSRVLSGRIKGGVR